MPSTGDVTEGTATLTVNADGGAAPVWTTVPLTVAPPRDGEVGEPPLPLPLQALAAMSAAQDEAMRVRVIGISVRGHGAAWRLNPAEQHRNAKAASGSFRIPASISSPVDPVLHATARACRLQSSLHHPHAKNESDCGYHCARSSDSAGRVDRRRSASERAGRRCETVHNGARTGQPRRGPPSSRLRGHAELQARLRVLAARLHAARSFDRVRQCG